MSGAQPITEISFTDLKLLRRGKVRDVFKVDEQHLLIVATDRISAFDCILPTPIPRKGEVLTALSRFWFERLGHITPHHMITTEVERMPDAIRRHPAELRGRAMLVRRTEVFPVECVVRGYLSGSGWKDYKQSGEVCGHRLPAGMRESDKLPAPLFTPSTKAAHGHDENISEAQMREIVGAEATVKLRDMALTLYREAEIYARTRGVIIADTKFEFGRHQNGDILLIDEALTPDSSRFWPADQYEAGRAQQSFDKQFVRDYLEGLAWDKQPPAPILPDEVAAATTARYLQAYLLLTGNEL
ncbi:MAG: phosphoribosylaminoimidazolesuccinocarboxamide synthase [Pyrinomonadaceae bacterium]|nr:phosphoribosylaminoimidazolesuccinocarboxamide synthase [Pyrinomonadaceae bacterium]